MTTDRKFTIKVNGVEISTNQQELKAGEILQLAKQQGAIPGNPEEYILKGEKREYRWDDTVDVAQDNIFIAILNTPTPVA
jgi:hypothetical protein